MAINQNHLFEELNGVKCAIVEKNVAPARVEFLRKILEYNGYTVVVVVSPPPKGAAAAPAAAAAAPVAPTLPGDATTPVPATASAAAPAPPPATPPPPPPPPPPETFTIGVTDVVFNPINAIFGRLLKALGGHIVTLAYWKQQEAQPDDERPYFE